MPIEIANSARFYVVFRVSRIALLQGTVVYEINKTKRLIHKNYLYRLVYIKSVIIYIEWDTENPAKEDKYINK